MTAIKRIDEIHSEICYVVRVVVQAPSKPNKYTIPVRICEKNVPETSLELTIIVTE